MRIAALGLLGFVASAAGSASARTQASPEPPAATISAPAPSSLAASAPLLGLDVSRCPAVPAGEVRDLVAIELHRPVALLAVTAATTTVPAPPAAAVAAPAPVPAATAGTTAATTTVRVLCDGLRADIAVDDPLTGKTVGRVVDLGAAAAVARPHLLALSIVELLAASWIELQSNPHPAAAPVGALGPGEGREAREAALELLRARPEAGPRARLLALGITQASGGGPLAWGAGLGAGGDRGAHLGWLADLAILHGEQSFALGRVTLETVSASAALVAHASRGRAAVRAGLGARGGGAWLSGTPVDPAAAVGGAVRGSWWGPLAVVDGSLTLRGRLVVAIGVEAGHVLRPVTATVQGAGAVAVDGTWLKGTLGVGLAL